MNFLKTAVLAFLFSFLLIVIAGAAVAQERSKDVPVLELDNTFGSIGFDGLQDNEDALLCIKDRTLDNPELCVLSCLLTKDGQRELLQMPYKCSEDVK